jgi:hypothetical protein
MSGFTKLFNDILYSSIWSEDDKTRLVWITMLALANWHGEVSAAIPGLAKAANVSIGDAEKALAKLMAPDPYSRTKDHEGRRIEAVDGGWIILNYVKHRERASEEDRREKARVRKQRQRDRESTSRTVTSASRPVTGNHAGHDIQIDIQTEIQTKKTPTKTTKLPKLLPHQKLLADRFESALGDQWVNDAGKWVNQIKRNHRKCERVIAEVESAIKEGRIKATPAQYAEYLWSEEFK